MSRANVTATFSKIVTGTFQMSRAALSQKCHGHVTGTFLLENCHGHFFAVTGTFPKIVTGCPKKCYEKKTLLTHASKT